jgi:hypothetical protein
VFNFDTAKAAPIYLNWKELGLPAEKPVHIFDFWNAEYLGAWAEGMIVDAAPTSCRVLTLVPATDRIELISTSRHITQGWVDLMAVSQNAAGDAFEGRSKVVKNDPYELRFAFPRGTNYAVTKDVARAGFRKLPVKISNHQGWAAVRITSPKTREISWEVRFAPADVYAFPPSAPTRPFVERVGLDGVNLRWQEQYYLTAGYQVYLDGALLGRAPAAMFPIRGLHPESNYTAQVKTVWEDGKESPKAAEVKFTLASLLPAELSLTELEPVRANGAWRGFEIEEMLLGGPLALGGRHYDRGLSSFAGSEIEFDLKGLYGKFTALVGLDAASSTNATAEFIVLADGKELWRSGALKRLDEPKPVDLGIAGVDRLILRTEGSGGRRQHAQADWIEPKVARSIGD